MSVTADAADIKLWWPAGVGAQPLYDVDVTFTPSAVDEAEDSGCYELHGTGLTSLPCLPPLTLKDVDVCGNLLVLTSIKS